LDTLAYCSDIAIPTGSDFYYASRFMEASRRAALICLQACWLEIRAVTRDCSDPGVALLKLQWWREELMRARRGQARHPLARALQERLPRAVPPTALVEVIMAMEEEVAVDAYPDYAAQASWHARAGGRIWQAFGQVCGSRAGAERLSSLAFAVELIDAMQNLRRDIQDGRRRFPLSALRQAGIDPPAPDLSTPAARISRLCAIQAREARARLAYGHAGTKHQPLPLPCLILARLAGTLLAELERDDYPCLRCRQALTPIRKLFIAWRAGWSAQSAPARP